MSQLIVVQAIARIEAMPDDEKDEPKGKTIRLPPPFVAPFESEYKRLLKDGIWTDQGATAAAALIVWLASSDAVRTAANEATTSFGKNPAAAIAKVRAAALADFAEAAMKDASAQPSAERPARPRKASGER